MFSKIGNSEMLRLSLCARAKVAYLISVTSSEANGLVAEADPIKAQVGHVIYLKLYNKKIRVNQKSKYFILRTTLSETNTVRCLVRVVR